MKTISVGELNASWADAERALETEEEIVITRDGEPVAKLTRIAQEPEPMLRFDLAEHRKWKANLFGEGEVVAWVADFCENGRADRTLVDDIH